MISALSLDDLSMFCYNNIGYVCRKTTAREIGQGRKLPYEYISRNGSTRFPGFTEKYNMKADQKRKKTIRARKRGILLWILTAACLCTAVSGDFGQSDTAFAEGAFAEASALRFNEYQSDNTATPLGPNGVLSDWIELKNDGGKRISLKGITLAPETKINKAFVFPDLVLEPGGTVFVCADGNPNSGDGLLHAAFRLSASGGETLLILDAGGNVLDRLGTVELRENSVSCRDDSGAWKVSYLATPGADNEIAEMPENVQSALEVTPGSVELSEAMSSNVMVFPDEDGNFYDYIELHNVTDADVDLAGYFLSDDVTRLMKWQLPKVTLPAHGFLAVHCSGLERIRDPAHLHAGFKLSSEGETVYLTAADQTVVSMVQLPALPCGTAYSRVDGEWTTSFPPTPGKENTYAAASGETGAAQAVYISEIMAWAAEDSTPDWVEICNASDESVDLSGYGLSDNPAKPRKWQFPEGVVLAPHACQCLLLTGESGATVKGRINVDFALSSDGGYPLCLASPEGKILDSVYLPVQYAGISYGRSSASGACGYYSDATPEAANAGQPFPRRTSGARASVPGGLFSGGDSFSVSLTADDGGRIYYTLDCTDPDEGSTLYTGTPIPVNSTTILRTRVYRDGYLPSQMDTQSYLFDVRNAEDVSYVVSLVSDPGNLYDETRGIMVMGPKAWSEFPYGDENKGANFWMDWERESHIELFAKGGETAISQECGIKLHGRNTRAYELKAFKIIARESYGDALFRYPIFSDRPYDDYEAFLLRYSGQDYTYTFMRDPLFTKLCADTDVIYQESELCIVYLNGAYYSAMYVREHITPYQICRERGWKGMEDEIDLIKSGRQVLQGSDSTYLDLKQWLTTHDTSTQEAYDRINAVIDIDNFLDFSALTIILEPPDTVDVKRYRNPESDGKWRWALYDIDRCFRDGIDGFELMAQGTNGVLFSACMNNPQIRDRFIERLDRLLAGVCSTEHLTDMVKSQFELIKPVLPDYLANLGVSKDRYQEKYGMLLGRLKKVPKTAIQQCANYLHLSDEEVLVRFEASIRKIQEASAAQ